MPRRSALPLHLRERTGALLLAAARLSWSSAGDLHARGLAPRISDRKRVRAELHGFVRAPGFHLRFLAGAATSGDAIFGNVAGRRSGTHPINTDSFSAEPWGVTGRSGAGTLRPSCSGRPSH